MHTKATLPVFVLMVVYFAANFLAAVNARAADPAKLADDRIAKVRADLKSEDGTVRQAAIGALVHSDISPKMLAEMRGALADRDGAVRSTTATAIGNLGTGAIAAIPQLVAQLDRKSTRLNSSHPRLSRMPSSA